MAGLVTFTVARQHQGDRLTENGTEVHLFLEGEPREADPVVVAQLVKSGVLVAPDAGKADEAPISNKAEGNAPENKGGTRKAATKPAESAGSKGE